MGVLTNHVLATQTPTRAVAGRALSTEKEDLLIVCAVATGEQYTNAIYALYYLPRSYKLVILTDGWAHSQAERQKIIELTDDEGLKGRVSFDSNRGMSERMSPFSFADVVLDGGGHRMLHTPMARNVSLRSGDSPESLASAILKAVRI